MTDAHGVCLAATCHDPLSRFVPGIESAGRLVAEAFEAALLALGIPTCVGTPGAGTVGIGTARKDALALGLRSGSARLLYSDLDHILRWLSTSRDEVDACLTAHGHDLLVVGRSPAALREAPDRLRLTEELVDRVFGLANGLDGRWDLMIAMRLMTRDTAGTIVAHNRETSIANDVTWPMLVAARGGTVGYVEADGIRFLARDDYGQEVDRRDDDPEEWRARMAMATAHVTAIVEFERT